MRDAPTHRWCSRRQTANPLLFTPFHRTTGSPGRLRPDAFLSEDDNRGNVIRVMRRTYHAVWLLVSAALLTGAVPLPAFDDNPVDRPLPGLTARGTLNYDVSDQLTSAPYEFDANGNTLRGNAGSSAAPTAPDEYDFANRLVRRTIGTKTIDIAYDGHGNVRFLTDDSGAITDTYTYDAFGILIEQRVWDNGSLVLAENSTVSPTPNFYLHAGEQYDPDLGLYYNRASYYEPGMGRFWTMDSYEGNSCDPLSLHKYLYAHGNPVMMTDPTGESALANVGITITVISALASSYEFAKSPCLITAGSLGLDLAQVGKLKYVAKGLFAIKNAISLRYITAAFPGGINALRPYQLALKSTTVGTHRHLAKELAEKGLSQTHQANHLNQAKAFTKIPEGQGLAVPLAGHATEAGSQHNRFHQVMEQFWDRYRSSTLSPDADDYKDAVEQALKAADIDAGDAMHLAEQPSNKLNILSILRLGVLRLRFQADSYPERHDNNRSRIGENI